MKINGQKLWESLFNFFNKRILIFFIKIYFLIVQILGATVFLTSFLILTSLALKCSLSVLMNGDCILQLVEPQMDKYERKALATHNAVAWQDRLTYNWLILEEVYPLPKASSVSSLPDWHRQWLSACHSSRCCFWSLCYQTASCLHGRKAFVSLRSLMCLQSKLHALVRNAIHIHKQIDFFLLYFERGN